MGERKDEAYRHAPLLRPGCKSLALIGAGRNAHNLICVFEENGVPIEEVYDDKPASTVLGYRVSPLQDANLSGRSAIITISEPETKERIANRDCCKTVCWTTFVDPRAVVSRRAELGRGVFIAPFATLVDVNVGDHVSVMSGAVLGTRVSVGRFSVILLSASLASECQVGEGVIVGMGARIHAGVTIGKGCRIAPNTVVRGDLPEYTLAFPGAGTEVRALRRPNSLSVEPTG